MIRRLALTGVFLAALFGSGSLLSEVQPFAMVPLLREKATHFSAHADDYDTLFFGTSRVYRGLMPAVFDELTARAGVPTRSFNLGIDGMFPPEDSYVFEHLLAHPPKHLRWVFLETNTVRTGIGNGDAESARNIHWHDTAHTLLEWRTLLAPPERKLRWRKLLFGSQEQRDPLAKGLTHTRLWVLRTLNSGRGGLLFQTWAGTATVPEPAPVLGSAGDGFVAAGGGSMRLPWRERAEYQRLYDERLAKPNHRSTLDVHAQRNLDAMLARIRAAGAQPILLIAPTLAEGRQYPRPGCDAPVFDFAEMEKWPELFRLEHRLDRAHLNAAGAELYTRAVAARFLELTHTTR